MGKKILLVLLSLVCVALLGLYTVNSNQLANVQGQLTRKPTLL
jgi:uncharacterized membrane protein (Fun14 family)